MKTVFDNLKQQQSYFEKAVVTLGAFDGVHLGHQALLREVTRRALELQLPAVVVTYEPHPVRVLRPEIALPLLTPLEEKLVLFEQFGIRECVVVRFDHSFAALSAQDFIEQTLIHKLGIAHLIVGFDHLFGRDREGTLEVLRKAAQQQGFGLTIVPPVESNGQVVKSSRIRKELIEGNLRFAEQLLGYPFSLSGTIYKGHGLGKTMGYPTMNISLPEGKIVPKQGVYICRVDLKSEHYHGMLYIGKRPTFEKLPALRGIEPQLSIEVTLFEYRNQTQADRLRVYPLDYIRPDQKFADAESLARQMRLDEAWARQRLAQGEKRFS